MTDRTFQTHRNITALALVFELGVGGIAFLAGWVFGQLPLPGTELANLSPREIGIHILIGAAATLPMLLLLPIVRYVRWKPLIKLNELVELNVVPLFSDCRIWHFAIISLAAGLGEELFFRAFLQSALADLGGFWVGLFGASLAFGLCHALSPSYVVLSGLIGIYMGLLFWFTDSLIPPVLAHALYDFIALIYLVRSRRSPD